MRNEKLNGRRYVALVRCSTDQQTETSIPDQLKLLDAFAAENGMISAGTVILDGVSGSKPGARTDIDEIINRKMEKDDFDILLLQDISRLTRGGAEHGAKVEFDLGAAGIDVVFASGSVPEGDHASICKSIEYFAAQQYARSVSFAVARGQMSAINDGRMAHCLRPPYGVDRLYLSMDNRPLHILRNLSDGSQQKLDPQTHAVMETYPRVEKGKPNLRYRKQKSEKIMLIPGEATQVAAVRQMFRRRLIEGWGNWRIAKELNDQGVLSPNGKPWSMQTVKLILKNPVYTGRGIANRQTASIYNMRSANSPTKSALSRKDWATRKQPKLRQRPRTEWIEQPLPALADYLGPELCELAKAFHAKVVNDLPPMEKVKADKHVDSSFILKGILKSRQGNHPMSGRTHGSKEKPYRYYHISTACRIPSSDRTMRRLVLADPIEKTVLTLLRETLLKADDLRSRVEASVREQLAAVQRDSGDLSDLMKQRAKIEAQLEFVLEELSSIGKDAAKGKVKKLEAQLALIDERMVKAALLKSGVKTDPIAVTDQIMNRLAEIGSKIDKLPSHALRSLLSILIARLEVDMETLNVEIELAIPNWAAFDQKEFEARMGLDEIFLEKSFAKAQSSIATSLGVFDCHRPTKDCYDCRRRAA
jgi:hypothetical protein